MSGKVRVLAFFAHPDDAEFLCAGSLARMHREAGCHITIATATSGDCGSATQRADEIARIRHAEAIASAAILQADYYCAGCLDLFITYDAPTIRTFVEIIRKACPDIVITHSPADYMVDHEMTSRLVRAATFGAPIPNVLTGDPDPAPVLTKVPFLYYADAMEFKNLFGQPIEPGFVVDVSGVMEIKEQMLCCHASQREWLRAHHNMDQYVQAMRQMSAERGKIIGAAYGEGFRQHLGHGYPQGRAISELLNV